MIVGISTFDIFIFFYINVRKINKSKVLSMNTFKLHCAIGTNPFGSKIILFLRAKKKKYAQGDSRLA